MAWLNPAALLAIVLAAAPVLIHLLVHRHAERFAFPTLRFIRPTRLAAIRRHVLEDVVLLVIRIAIIAGAVAAFAGPLIVGAARRAQWEARTARAIVVQETDGGQPAVAREASFRRREFRVKSIADGIHRAIAWLGDSPPARREIVIAGPLTIGSIREAELAAIPREIGIRFARIGTAPANRSVDVAAALTAAGTARRTVTLAGPASIVRTAIDSAPVRWPIEIVAPPAQRPAIDAAVHAVLSQHVLKPPPDRTVKLILMVGPNDASEDLHATEIRTSWMADAIARVARDRE